MAMRARIVLSCGQGMSNSDGTKQLQVTGATVGKWRERFREFGQHTATGAGRSGIAAGRCPVRTLLSRKWKERNLLVEVLEDGFRFRAREAVDHRLSSSRDSVNRSEVVRSASLGGAKQDAADADNTTARILPFYSRAYPK